MIRFLSFAAILAALGLGAVAQAQWSPPAMLSAMPVKTGGSAGPFAIVAHAGAANVTVTGNVDCTGATMAVVIVNQFTSPASNPSPADTGCGSSCTYTQIGTQVGDSSHNSVAIWWASLSGTLTSFHWGVSALSFGAIEGACFSDGSTPSSVDKNSNTANSNQPGSVTPSINNELLVSGFQPPQGGSGTPTIGSSFNVTDAFAFNAGGGIGGGMAYKIQTTAGAENPLWSTSGGGTGSSVIATFK